MYYLLERHNTVAIAIRKPELVAKYPPEVVVLCFKPP